MVQVGYLYPFHRTVGGRGHLARLPQDSQLHSSEGGWAGAVLKNAHIGRLTSMESQFEGQIRQAFGMRS